MTEEISQNGRGQGGRKRTKSPMKAKSKAINITKNKAFKKLRGLRPFQTVVADRMIYGTWADNQQLAQICWKAGSTNVKREGTLPRVRCCYLVCLNRARLVVLEIGVAQRNLGGQVHGSLKVLVQVDSMVKVAIGTLPANSLLQSTFQSPPPHHLKLSKLSPQFRTSNFGPVLTFLK